VGLVGVYVHFLGQARHRSGDRHPSRSRRLPQFRGNFFGRVPEFDAPHDYLTVRGSKPAQSVEEKGKLLPRDDLLKGRRPPIGWLRQTFDSRAAPPRPSNQVAHTVDDGLPEVGLKASHRSMLETFDPSEGSQKSILNDVFSVRVGPSVSWQTAPCPSADRRQRPFDENLDRPLVAILGPLENIQSGIGQLFDIRRIPVTRHIAKTGRRFLSGSGVRTRDNVSA
jgi:hypothetical protein